MQKMSKISCGIIYAIKRNKEGHFFESVAAFLSAYTDTPIKYYSESIIENMLSSAIGDLLNNMKYPCTFWSEYCRMKQYPWLLDDFNAKCSALSVVQVKDKDEYINGFRPFEEYESLI